MFDLASIASAASAASAAVSSAYGLVVTHASLANNPQAAELLAAAAAAASSSTAATTTAVSTFLAANPHIAEILAAAYASGQSVTGHPYLAPLLKWVQENPGEVAQIIGPAVVCLAPGVATVPILGPLGFGPLGPVKGSLAAAIQGPAVAKGSAFAIAQATGMGAGVTQLVSAVGGVAGAGRAVWTGVMAWGK